MTPADESSAAGDPGGAHLEYRALYEQHGDAMLRTALRILGHQADAEDAVQEVFLAIHRSRAGFRGESGSWTWLYRIVVNTSLKMLRKRRRLRETPLQDLSSTADETQDSTERTEMRDRLNREIQALPLKQRLTFTLTAVEGFSPTEAATILGIQSGTARYHLSVAKARLRSRLTAFLPQAPHDRSMAAAEPREDRSSGGLDG